MNEMKQSRVSEQPSAPLLIAGAAGNVNVRNERKRSETDEREEVGNVAAVQQHYLQMNSSLNCCYHNSSLLRFCRCSFPSFSRSFAPLQ